MRTPIAFAVLILAHSAWAASTDEEDLALAYGETATVSVATGSAQSLRRAPAVASVFTAEDIRAMGATDLEQILERVPGLHVGKSYFMYDASYQMRGVKGDFNQQILLLIDGVRHQGPHTGGHGDQWINMPSDQIERVEVIRGPGSALYGADAVSGVISITTIAAGARPGVRAGVQWGDNGAHAFSLQGAGQMAQLKWSGYARAGRTNGADEVIAVDAQTALDALFKSRASRAPGSLNTQHEDFDLNLKAVFGNWHALLNTKRRNNMGSGAGLTQALSPDDRGDSEHAVLAIDWRSESAWNGWTAQGQGSITRTQVDSWLRLFPKGAFAGAFPDGMIGTPGRDTRVLDLEFGATYHDWQGHRLRLGAGARDSDLYAVRERKNFNFVLIPGVGNVPVPIGQLVDVSSTQPYINPQLRRMSFVLIQDEWNLAKDWNLTFGVRRDQYSDFGEATNPRMALLWDASNDLTMKLLHGTAFRAPAFVELYTVNNPVALGNPNARPERMATSELVFDWQAAANLHGTLNLFSYRMSDILRAVPNTDPFTGNTFANLGEQTGRGFETEWRWKPRTGLQMVASYSHQDSRDGLTDAPVADTPQRMLKLALDWQLANAWGTQLQARHVGQRLRAPGDTRPAVSDLNALDLALRWNHPAARGWSATLSINNLLDRDLREPSPAPGSIPFDFPLPGRQVVLQSNYRF